MKPLLLEGTETETDFFNLGANNSKNCQRNPGSPSMWLIVSLTTIMKSTKENRWNSVEFCLESMWLTFLQLCYVWIRP